jgi:hypothetical protein
MAGLPKKYAKMGFKKGWAAYKKTKGSKSKSTKRTTRMAKKSISSTSKSFGSTFLGRLTKKAIPVVYGMTRNKISDAVANSAIGKAVPVFRFTDEATMLGLNALATYFGARKNPIVRRALQAQEDIELSNVGEELERMMSQGKQGNGGLFA